MNLIKNRFNKKAIFVILAFLFVLSLVSCTPNQIKRKCDMTSYKSTNTISARNITKVCYTYIPDSLVFKHYTIVFKDTSKITVKMKRWYDVIIDPISGTINTKLK